MTQAPPPLEGMAYQLAEAAYQAKKTGDLPGALHSVERALTLTPDHPQLLDLKLDLLFSSGKLEEADTLSLHLLSRRPTDSKLALFRVYILQRQGRSADALREATRLTGQVDSPEEVRFQARLAMADSLQSLGRSAEALASLDQLKASPSPEVQSRRAFLLLAVGQPDSACKVFESALVSVTDPTQRKTLLQGLHTASRAAKRSDLELKALQQLRAQDSEDRRMALELAYAYLSRQRDAEALEQFSTALNAQSSQGAWLDAGYAAKRLGRNAEAAAYFSKGLDAREREGLHAPAQDFGLRREVESLSRTWGFVSGTSYRQGGLIPGIASQQKILQQGLEVYWQPTVLARNGRMVQFFVQTFENLYSGNDDITGGPTLQGVMGVRAKPFRSENLVLTAQKLVKLGHFSMDDWMFRAAYSRDEGLDVRPWQQAWTYWTLYTEGATFARTGQYVHQLEVRAGRAWRLPTLGGRNVLAPHVVLGGDFDNRMQERHSLGAGLGISLRRWFREDRHHAPASWIDATIQGRVKLTEADRGGGLFLTLTCWF